MDPPERDGRAADRPPSGAPRLPADVHRTVAELRHHLEELEHLMATELLEPAAAAGLRRRPTAEGEQRWPVAVAVAVAIGLQVLLPDRLSIRPSWVLPALEGVLLVALVVINPRRINRRSSLLRAGSVALVAVISAANGWSSFELIRSILRGTGHLGAPTLLSSGASIYLTNIIVFALWFWEWDRGGPVARFERLRPYPDFLFPQQTQTGIARPDWTPTFIDYLYTSYTNAAAFSPTDVMPLAPWAKLLMFLQSAVALATVALVVARAVNILA